MSLAIPGIGPGWYFETHYLDLTPLFLSGQGEGDAPASSCILVFLQVVI